MSELYDRIKQYRSISRITERQNIEGFRQAVALGLYPRKCLACYEAGIRFCGFWLKNFNCGEFETGKIEELIERFV